jgi:hypothetical protein
MSEERQTRREKRKKMWQGVEDKRESLLEKLSETWARKRSQNRGYERATII